MVDGQSVLFLSVDRNKRSIAIDLQMETFICYLNGPRPESVVPPNWIAGWHYAAPHEIYATTDGHLAISMASLKTVGEALSSPEVSASS
jgi:crotonobetainyl-CoA:carnitine CoA-transferase CaiB-like acyl-CoA transferase